jgi:hypothetical protein
MRKFPHFFNSMLKWLLLAALVIMALGYCFGY